MKGDDKSVRDDDDAVLLGEDRQPVLVSKRAARHAPCGPFVGMLDPSFGETEIAQFDVPVRIQQNVFGFQISVNDAAFVQVSNREQQFGGVESRHAFREAAKARQVEKEFTAGTVIKHQIQFVGCLKGVVQFHDKGMVDDRENLSFRPCSFNLSPLDQVRLFEDFHGEELSAFFSFSLLYEDHLRYRFRCDVDREGSNCMQ